MSKSIRFKNNVYIAGTNVNISRNWTVNNMLVGQNSLTSGEVYSGVYNKLLTITLKGAYLRSYVHLEVADTEMGYLMGDLYMFFRMNSSGQQQMIYAYQRMVKRSFNTYYLYVTKNNQMDYEVQLWVYTTASWSSPYFRVITANPLTSITTHQYQQTTEPTNIQKIEFTTV